MQEKVLVYIDPRTKEPCKRCDGKGFMPPWPGSNGKVPCGVCRPEAQEKDLDLVERIARYIESDSECLMPIVVEETKRAYGLRLLKVMADEIREKFSSYPSTAAMPTEDQVYDILVKLNVAGVGPIGLTRAVWLHGKVVDVETKEWVMEFTREIWQLAQAAKEGGKS